MICAGMTLAFWYRHIPCLDAQCEIKVLYFGWGGIYIQDNACYIEVKVEGEPQGEYWYFEKFGILSKFHLKGDKVWRHIAFQFDEDAEMMRFFLDGTLAMEGPSLAAVSEMDLEETKLLQVAGQPDFFQFICYCRNCTCFVVDDRPSTLCTLAATGCIENVRCLYMVAVVSVLTCGKAATSDPNFADLLCYSGSELLGALVLG
jgi:hypothetical protein